MAGTLCRNQSSCRMRDKISGRKEVDLEDRPEFFFGHQVHRSIEAVSGIREHDVEPTEVRLGRVEQSARQPAIGRIRDEHFRTAAIRLNLGRDGVESLAAARRHENRHARAREGSGTRFPDAAGRTGDDGDLSIVTTNHVAYRSTRAFVPRILGEPMIPALLLAFTLPTVSPQAAPSAAPSAAAPPLRVGTATRLPYSWKGESGAWEGPAITLWDKIAQRTGIRYELVERSDDTVTTGLIDGSLDIVATGIQISAELEKQLDLSLPFDAGGFSVAVHNRQTSRPWMMLERVLAFDIFVWIIWIGVATVIAGLAIRFVERRHNPDHFGQKASTINGFWWAITTLSTVGYGDLVPRSTGGKVLAAAWMLTSLLLVTLFTSSVVSAITVGRLTPYFMSIHQMDANLVGIVDRPASKVVAKQLGLLPRVYPTPDAVFKALESGEIEGFVHPTNELRALVFRRHNDSLMILPREVVRGFVGLGLSERLPPEVLNAVNSALLEVVESPEWTAVAQQMDHPSEGNP